MQGMNMPKYGKRVQVEKTVCLKVRAMCWGKSDVVLHSF